MVSGLEKEWGKLKLTDEEEEVLEWESYSPRIRSMQRLSKTLCAMLRDPQMFFLETDRDFALNEVPWAFDGSILLLKQMIGLEQPSEMNFSRIRFWVKAYDLPMKKKTYDFAQVLVLKFRDFVDVDEEDVLASSIYLKFRVDVDVTKPLHHDIMVNVGGNPKWISFKYVKLPDFCYGCGKLEHVWRGCLNYKLDIDDSDLQYGVWMKGLPIWRRQWGMEDEYKEEKRQLLELRDDGSGSRVRPGLLLESPLQSKILPDQNAKNHKA
ncbi:hypothetical protein Cgig2_008738 [Carnegiea gigantea]|uniref:Zinc knuckle CX2CX4HX4C domain-containing protein n=1 Tax=Carnegiea gigantea TaxID=171969 RepID=A0A9Q1QGN3_9CARY|nr:hypothetical protein Cgig2_008738 [Carnegiea gigantea]